MLVKERIETAISKCLAENASAAHIADMVLHQLAQPSLDVIVQGCHALESTLAKNMIRDAEYSGDRYEKARIKMKLRWKAMIKAIQAGM